MQIDLCWVDIFVLFSSSMSQSSGPPPLVQYPPWGNPGEDPPIVPTPHDVLSGRGVNIAQHPGNERFRALVNSRYDSNYCSQYSTTEKRAVAREIIGHIQALNPPGRFLKRLGRAKNSRGLEGPWEELSEQDAIKKTCQALRDCNRQDRTGYASSVAVPEDVRYSHHVRSSTGLSNKQQAEQAAAVTMQLHRQQAHGHLQQAAATAAAAQPSAVAAPVFSVGNINTTTNDNHNRSFTSEQHPSNERLKRPREEELPHSSVQPLRISTSISPVDHHHHPHGDWLKKQRFEGTTPLPTTTPTTAASSSGMLQDTSLLDSVPSSTASPPHHHSNAAAAIFLGHDHGNLPPSPAGPTTFEYAFADTFDRKPEATDLDPLHLSATESHPYAMLTADDVFPPPSPLHPGDQNHHQNNNNNTTNYYHHHHHHQGGLAHGHFED